MSQQSLIQLAAAAVSFPAGLYLSMRSQLRCDWRKHIPKGRQLKVPVLAMISIFSINDRFKSRRWLIWEQKHWFRDMRTCHGIEVAYRDVRCWKRARHEERK